MLVCDYGWGEFYLQDARAKLQVQIAAVLGRLVQVPHLYF